MRSSPAAGPARRARAPIFAWVLLGLAALLVGGWMVRWGIPFEEQMIFFPSRQIVATPAAVGLPFEEVRFGPEGRLHGWFVPGRSRVTLLWFHGNAGNIAHRLSMMKRFHDSLGVGIFIFDYQGFGLSGGRPSESATAADARDALAYLRTRADVEDDRIVYFGKSIGAAVAIELATVAPPYRLVAQSAFTTIADMARLHYPFLPVGRLLRTRYPNLELIGRVAAPVLIIHGAADEIAPVEHARALYEAAAEPKRLWIVPGARHNDVIDVGGRAYLDVLREFCETDRE